MLVVPDKMSREKIFNLKAMGARGRADALGRRPRAIPSTTRTSPQRIASETPGAYFINQFGNPDNPAAHEYGTGPEICEQMDGELDAVVFGCRQLGGTMTGLSRCFAQHVAARPK